MTSSAKGLILTGIRQEAWLWSSNSYQEPGEDRSRISVSVLDEGGGGGGGGGGQLMELWNPDWSCVSV